MQHNETVCHTGETTAVDHHSLAPQPASLEGDRRASNSPRSLTRRVRTSSKAVPSRNSPRNRMKKILRIAESAGGWTVSVNEQRKAVDVVFTPASTRPVHRLTAEVAAHESSVARARVMHCFNRSAPERVKVRIIQGPSAVRSSRNPERDKNRRQTIDPVAPAPDDEV